MKPIQFALEIAAPLDLVFETVSDVRNFRKAIPHITNIDFVTEQQAGVGTRFRETRLMNGREHTSEIEVAEYVQNDRVRMISDAGGTVWDTLFSLTRRSDGVTLEMRMDIKPHTFSARIITPLIRGMVVKGVTSDMEAIKTYCESNPYPGENE